MEILYPGKSGTLLNIALGYCLILLTIWSTRSVQRKLFWIDVAFFLSVVVLAVYRSPDRSLGQIPDQSLDRIPEQSLAATGGSMGDLEIDGSGEEDLQHSNALVRFFRQRLRLSSRQLSSPHLSSRNLSRRQFPPVVFPRLHFLPVQFPPLQFSIIMIGFGLITAVAVLLVSAKLGTLHGLTYKPRPLLHVGMYLMWAVVQQWIQQVFFFVRFERVIHSGVLASFTTAALFGLAHVPNPVLTPLTFAGGWLLSELYRRYRSVVPLGIAHGLVGIAIALAVPDQINHHMRVGLGYLQYIR